MPFRPALVLLLAPAYSMASPVIAGFVDQAPVRCAAIAQPPRRLVLCELRVDDVPLNAVGATEKALGGETRVFLSRIPDPARAFAQSALDKAAATAVAQAQPTEFRVGVARNVFSPSGARFFEVDGRFEILRNSKEAGLLDAADPVQPDITLVAFRNLPPIFAGALPESLAMEVRKLEEAPMVFSSSPRGELVQAHAGSGHWVKDRASAVLNDVKPVRDATLAFHETTAGGLVFRSATLGPIRFVELPVRTCARAVLQVRRMYAEPYLILVAPASTERPARGCRWGEPAFAGRIPPALPEMPKEIAREKPSHFWSLDASVDGLLISGKVQAEVFGNVLSGVMGHQPDSPALALLGALRLPVKLSGEFSISFWVRTLREGAAPVLTTKDWALEVHADQAVTFNAGVAHPMLKQVWNHCVIVTKGNLAELYLNATRVDRLKMESPAATDDVVLGGQGFAGVLDEIAVFPRRLSAAAVEKLFWTGPRVE